MNKIENLHFIFIEFKIKNITLSKSLLFINFGFNMFFFYLLLCTGQRLQKERNWKSLKRFS